MDEKKEINTAQLELAKLYNGFQKDKRFNKESATSLRDCLKKESLEAFKRAGFKIIDGGDNECSD